MRRRAAVLFAGAGLAMSLGLGGCAVAPREAVGARQWSGRLALQVAGDAARSFSAGFELRGSAQEGSLELATPLGGTAARIEWEPGRASLRAPGQPARTALSLDELVAQAIGVQVPVAALFDWLDGLPTAAAGWQADLSQRPAGRLRARRLAAPTADLRLVLEAP